MKKIYPSLHFSKMPNKKFLFLLMVCILFTAGMNSQTTYSFTNCSATGSVGPTQPQVNSAYLLTNLNGSVTSLGGVQYFTVPITSSYSIVAAGAGAGSASNFGGRGRVLSGETMLSAGTVLKILVGQMGVCTNTASQSSGGGGGSFISTSLNAPILVAGGGGGFLLPVGAPYPNSDANIGTSGFNSNCGTGLGGINGNGGTGTSGGWGGGGGGFNTNGTNASACNPTFGQAFINGGLGGGTCNNAPGGFGGGAGTHGNTGGGGGGGGYSGGGGSHQSLNPNFGGGGGSYFDGTLTNTTAIGYNLTQGYVLIIQTCTNIPVAPTNTTDVANYTVCPGSTTTLAATGLGGNITWHPTMSSAVVLGTGTTFITPTLTPGTYTYWAMETNTCSTSPRTPVSFTVIPSPSVTISGNISLCTGYSVNLTASGADTYSWNTGATTSTVTGLASTQFTVVGISALTGCSASAVSELTLVPAPSLTIAGASSICATNVLSLTASGADTYFWNTGATTPGISATLTSNTTYTLVGTFTANGCTTRVQKTILVNPLPILSVTGANTICAGETATITASGAAGYFWSTGPSTASVGLSPNTSTTYSVVGVSDAGCTSTLIVNVYLQCVGIKSHAGNSVPVSIYPNPTNGEFTIEMKNGLKKTVEVMDLTGRIVVVELSDKDKIDLNISAFANGIYYVKVRTKMSVDVIKIVKL